MHVRKPSLQNGEWVVTIAENISPISKVIEVVKCGKSREEAWLTYRQIMKDLGRGY